MQLFMERLRSNLYLARFRQKPQYIGAFVFGPCIKKLSLSLIVHFPGSAYRDWQ